jgi:hypothetical protein
MAKTHLRVVNDLGAPVPKSTLRVLNPENPDGEPLVQFAEGVAEVDAKVAKELLAQDLGVTVEEFTPDKSAPAPAEAPGETLGE